jgi:cytochrome c peroxidase
LKRKAFVYKLTVAMLAVFRVVDGASTTDVFPTREEAKKQYVRPAEAPYPSGNAPTAERVLLGKALFFDPRLSGSGSISCASCHNPGFSWGDGLPRAIGQERKQMKRRTPTVLNAAWAELLFWDGRAESLEEQALLPIQASGEMNLPLKKMLAAIVLNAGYQRLFAAAYPGEVVELRTVAKAIASFERTVVSGVAPFDFWVGGDEGAISEEAKRGFDLFNNKARCASCHTGWAFTDYGFHDIGTEGDDLGRGAELPKLEAMQHAFKTPTLRNVVERAPYLHDGSVASIEEAIDAYDRGGRVARNGVAPDVRPLHLTAAEKKAVVAFLHTLSSIDPPVAIPMLPH